VEESAHFWQALFKERLQGGLLISRDLRLPGRSGKILSVAAGHPLPDQRSLKSAKRCLSLLRGAGRKDCVVLYLMGGASSLLAKPAAGLTLEDKRKTTELLLKSGMNISEMNCVRKHLSAIKAGGLLRHAYPARLLTLAVSDVLGDDPTVIGSALTFHDPTTYKDAWMLLERYGLLARLPGRVRAHLSRGLRGEIPETLKPGSALVPEKHFVLLANNQDALSAAKDKAVSLGFATTILTASLSGDTTTEAKRLCAFLKRTMSYRRPHCFLLGGETTVTVRGRGQGGRNQEFALASAIEISGSSGLYMLSAGTDGSDGTTPAAGAFADGTTLSKGEALGLDARRALRENDSYRFFKTLGELFCPGPTGTNVLDLKVILSY
jgi:glycerate-2-kinase